MADEADLLPGTLDLLILKSVSLGSEHGYGILLRIQQITGDVLQVRPGALYPALHRMEEAGWITAEWVVTENKRRARIYRITKAGIKQLALETERWTSFSAGVARVLRHA